ncbi:MAG: pyridoxal phosphate-dependent aminotransferase [Clostridiales bacterium]|nr:pyridoxal phosphate-dependent aminotransferase [Clostridiales bacterium]
MKLSQKLLSIGHSPIRRFAAYANQAVKDGKKVYFVNIGQPDIRTPQVFFDAINNFNKDVVEYAPSAGIPNMVEAIKNYYARYGMVYQDDEILVTAGGSEAIQFTLMAILDPGDEVIIAEPYYSNYATFVTMAGGKIVPITTVAENGYSYANRELIEKAITPKTKALFVTSPGNPTGNVLSKEDMRMIVDLAKKHGFFIISDEVYREMVYDGRKIASMGEFEDAAQHVVIIDSISKRFSACGARVGCILTKNKELYSNLMKLCQGRLSVATLDQAGAAALYNELSPTYFDDVKAEYERRRNVCYEELSKIDGIVCEKPAGAFYITAKLPVDNAEDFLVWLLTEFDVDGETVMFAPAEGFYATPGLGKNEIRIAYVLKEEDLKKAMNIIRLGIEKYNKR